jgi:monooxygenase
MDVDVLIVGAGISGISAACHLQKECPNKSYAILEARESIGGTWDLFRYPGVRSDSDMYTLGFSFRPWASDQAIVGGASIRDYIEDTAKEHGVIPHIVFKTRVIGASWSTAEARWSVEVKEEGGETSVHTCRFLYACAGYYDYDQGYTPELPGRERFQGPIVHPQHWDPSTHYAGKRVVVIGSGATAFTLVPALAKTAAHVTMLQRSPTYAVAMPSRDIIASTLRKLLPERIAFTLIRAKNTLMQAYVYGLARWLPTLMARFILMLVKKQLPGVNDVEKHFRPHYKPWDQRMCLVPDADFFAAMRAGKATVETDEIAEITEHGVRLVSGKVLEADLLVTATGLNIKVVGGMRITVDGEKITPQKTLTYKGVMLSDVPNFVFTMGYTNASWTMKAELTSKWVCRVLNAMDAGGFTLCAARPGDQATSDDPLVDFTPGYVKRASKLMPQQGETGPWRFHQSYFKDLAVLRFFPLDDTTLELRR